MKDRVQLDLDKSMYVCSIEYRDDRSAYLVHAIKLKDLFWRSDCEILLEAVDDGDDHDDRRDDVYCGYDPHYIDFYYNDGPATTRCINLRKVASRCGKDLPGDVGCGVSGSKIIFAGGIVSPKGEKYSKGIYVFESDSSKPSIEEQNCFGNFQIGKPQPLVVEVAGNLYALAGLPTAGMPKSKLCFDVFDWASKSWLPLPMLPFTPYRYSRHSASTTYFSYAIAGSKIMVSSPGNVVHCFDVADPTKQWRKLHSMCPGLSFPFHGRALVVDLDDEDDGTTSTEKIIFTYQLTRTKGWAIVAYRMINDSLELLKAFKPIQSLPAGFAGRVPYSLVHLGDGHFSLVIAKQVYTVGGDLDMEDVNMFEKMSLLVITFKFHYLRTAKETSSGNSDRGSGGSTTAHDSNGSTTAHGSKGSRTARDSICFDVKCLGCRILDYHWNQDHYPVDETTCAKLLGCFVL